MAGLNGLLRFILVPVLVVVCLCCASRRGYYHRVAKGETLYRISKAYGVPIERVAHSNNMRDLGHIREGQYLLIPGYEGKRRSGIPPKNKQRRANWRKTVPQRLRASNLSGRFIWPLRQSQLKRVALGFGKHRRKKHSGIDIIAPAGTTVTAVADGRVIYTGNDVEGFGKTVIIRHAEEIFSVYSYLGAILVTRDTEIKQGASVGAVGSPNTDHFKQDQPLLHFEIRERTVPVNPENLLP